MRHKKEYLFEYIHLITTIVPTFILAQKRHFSIFIPEKKQ